ncbi:MAG: hypothetical protein LBV19_00945 [Streptococcaceae bacterium]|nr:hypothetical protein [Streptococcaceae bacterium]
MKKKLVYLTVFAFSLPLFCAMTRPASADVQMYRLYNPNSGEHFYTASQSERDHVLFSGWKYEGIGWQAPESGSPVYRLYNPNAGDHFYTMSSFERDQLVLKGWNYEGISWYSGGEIPLYRSYNPNAQAGAHNYTTSQNEANMLAGAGWSSEGISWYGVKQGQGLNSNGEPHKDILGYHILTQQDPAWAYKTFGSSTVGSSGCGLLSVIMAADALQGRNLTPNDVIDWANSTAAFPFEDRGESTIPIAQHLGLKTQVLFDNPGHGQGTSGQIEQINQILRSGGMVLISGKSVPAYAPYGDGQLSPFTTSGHYVVIKKLTADGKWMIFDSNDAIHPLDAGLNNNLSFNPTDIMRDQGYYAIGLTR